MADLIKNFAYCKLTANVAAADTTFPVDDVTRLPTDAQVKASDFYMTVDSPLATGAFEVVKVTGVNSTPSVTVLRAQEGTTAVAHNSGDYLKSGLTAGILGRLVPSAGADTTASHYKGAWGSTAAYSANDQVSESYALYAALAAVPSGKGAPSTGPTYLPASAFLGGTTASGTSVGSSASIAQAFTTPTSGSPTVSSISFSVNNTSTGLPAGTFKVGIASALGASPSAVTWVGAPSAVVSVAAGAPLQTLTATLATPATLAPSTQYWVVFQTADAAGAGASVVTAVNSGATVSAGAAVASLGASAYEPSWSSASTVAWYSTSGTQTLAWSLYSGSVPYWQKVATITAATTKAVTAAYTMSVADQVVLASGTFAVTLPSASLAAGNRYTVKNTGSGAVTVVPASGLIDGQASLTIGTQYVSYDFVTDGTNWFVV